MTEMGDNYLAPDLRDFHNQKDAFKKMYQHYKYFIEKLPPYMAENLKNLTWVDLHIVGIDFILWHLAKQGYTLKYNKKFKENIYND